MLQHPILNDLITEEQLAIIYSNGNIKINAVAGSGKTTTIIEYAATRPKDSKILYLAFNKSVKLEAQRKFAAKGLNNVEVHTAHSLAFKHIMRNRKYKIKSNGYKTTEIVELLSLKGNNEKHTEHVIANHISKFITYFCNSDVFRVQQLNYLDTINDDKAESFVRTFYPTIEQQTRIMLAQMQKGEIEITHDFYLKLFQLSKPKLPYDYILFDEGQDASMVMLDIFLSQDAVKVIVGDKHQQIYGWRFAVNALEYTFIDALDLSVSFRFPQSIALLAVAVLKWKKHLDLPGDVKITGNGSSEEVKTKATIARSNLALLVSAINYVTDNRKVKHIYFEGNIHSYTYADDGASLYDVLNLANLKHHLIRDPLIKSMNSLDDLEEYIEKTEDVQLAMMVELVKEYGNEISDLIKSLKELHVPDDQREKAEMVFSTVHRAKGMEYDVVYLAEDFITEERIIRLTGEKKDKDTQPVDYSKLNEEINLLYVAITRAKNKLHIPETLLPKNFPTHKNIEVVKAKKKYDNAFYENLSDIFDKTPKAKDSSAIKDLKQKKYTLEEKRQVNKDAYNPWDEELDFLLTKMYKNGAEINYLAERFGRTKGAIISRLKKLNIYEQE